MTRQFNVKDEIEFKEDLDNKPDNEEIKAFLENSFESALLTFVRDLRELKEQKKYKAIGKDSFWISYYHNFCAEGREDAGSSTSAVPHWIEKPFLALHSNLDLASRWKSSDLPAFIELPANSSEGSVCKSFTLSSELNKSDISVEVSFSRGDAINASHLVGKINEYLLKRSEGLRSPLTEQIYLYTKATSNSTNVLIVTRLPRAGLDVLLASASK